MELEGCDQKEPRPSWSLLTPKPEPTCHTGRVMVAPRPRLAPEGMGLGLFSPDSSLSVFLLAEETFCLLV